jgi:hypothetical protein
MEYEPGIVEELITTEKAAEELKMRFGDHFFHLLRDLVNYKIKLESDETGSLEILAGFAKKKALCQERIELLKLQIARMPPKGSLGSTSRDECDLDLVKNEFSYLLANIHTFDESIKTEQKVLNRSIDLTRTELEKLIDMVKEEFECDPTAIEFLIMLNLNN